jgi:endonuclease G, mitochondrial
VSTLEEQVQRLRRFNRSVSGGDRELREEVLDVTRAGLESLEEGAPTVEALALETIVLKRSRPVLAIKDNQTELVFDDQQDSVIWKDRLTKAGDVLAPAIRAVGRIDVAHNREYEWVGTGWLVDTDILVTNRHVAKLFATRTGETFRFRPGEGGPMAPSIDFLHEIDSPKALVFELGEILHLEPDEGPDLAFLRIAQTAGNGLAGPITLRTSAPDERAVVATIGYPAQDSRIPDFALMQRIYGHVYDMKRLAPGSVMAVDEDRLSHNCTTLGGNSGSVVFDLDAGEAVGLHFSGTFLQANYAVRADVVKRCLETAKRKRNGSSGPLAAGRPVPPLKAPAPRMAVRPEVRRGSPAAVGTHSVTISVPLVVTVSLGTAADAAPSAALAVPVASDEDDAPETEAQASSYDDRAGFKEDFLGKRFVVRRPEVTADAGDVLVFGDDRRVLDYEHFSLVMSRRRRLCRWSAVNIDGHQSRKSTRAAWRTDPRIARSQQILNECYGSPPRFSRGHMTRREDPAWGTPAAVMRGNEDSMHVTNTVPQMQSFNAPIWLGLENYALQHARQDDMRISVITGPYLDDANDATLYGVQVPIAFWKIIAFIHDRTGKLCATGYEMSQQANLLAPEFVFANFVSPQLNVATQVPIRSIELRSGIDFADLADHDPLATEGPEGPSGPLLGFDQIRFL